MSSFSKKSFLFNLGFAVAAFATNGTLSGDGSYEHPWEISDYEDLKAFGRGAYAGDDKYFVLTKDIDASSSASENCKLSGCYGYSPIDTLSGILDGGKHTIKNLYINSPSAVAVGFIAHLKGEVSNLYFDGLDVTGDENYPYGSTGGVVGVVERGRLFNVRVKNGSVHGWNRVGGVVGSCEYSYRWIQNLSFQGSVKGINYVGGIVGKNHCEMKSLTANVDVFVDSSAAGGIAGRTERRITHANVSGTVVPMRNNIQDAGGIVGECAGTIVDSSYSWVDLLDNSTQNKIFKFGSDVGGTVGYEYSCSASDNYSLGMVQDSASMDLSALGVPVAVPTAAAKWQKDPVVLSSVDVGADVFGKWTGWSRLNATKDSLYFGYKIGFEKDGDTLWGSTSYMAVPNLIEISTLAELQKIGKDGAYPLYASYALTADIDAVSSKFEPIGDSIYAFSGKFDGRNHSIKNLTIQKPKGHNTGLFGYASGAEIKNLKLKNAKVEGLRLVGALGGTFAFSQVSNVVSTDADVSGSFIVGGLVGGAMAGQFDMVATTGKVVGKNGVGGVFGSVSTIIENAYSVNLVKGEQAVAGLVGLVHQKSGYPHKILKTYSASIVKSLYPHGLVDSDMFSDWGDSLSYFDSTLIDNPSGRIALSTEQMLRQSTYEHFDFDSVWTIEEGKSYPYFKGLDPVYPGSVKNDESDEFSTVSVAKVLPEHFAVQMNGEFAELAFVLNGEGLVAFALMDLQGRSVRYMNMGRRGVGSYLESVSLSGLRNGQYIGVLQVNGIVKSRSVLLKK